MAEAVKTEHPHVVRLEGFCGGEPVIDGLRVTVRHVVTLHRLGETTLEIAEALGITEAQVFHALSYFFDHRDEILALVAREEQAHARFAHP
jgi:uncharacterized protein (DUF433 family)